MNVGLDETFRDQWTQCLQTTRLLDYLRRCISRNERYNSNCYRF